MIAQSLPFILYKVIGLFPRSSSMLVVGKQVMVLEGNYRVCIRMNGICSDVLSFKNSQVCLISANWTSPAIYKVNVKV